MTARSASTLQTAPGAALRATPSDGFAVIDEAALLARLRAGDEQAFEQIVREFGGRMLAAARRLLGSDDDAADAVQEAFISAFRSLHQFEGGARLGTWLHRIAINAALMKLRARRRRGEVAIEGLLPTFTDDGHRRNPRPAWAESSADLLERRETIALVRARIDQLPDDYRTVLMLRDIEELSTEETAEVLGIRPGAVKTRLHRARMALRELLERELAA
jgi:RNA polymerase sigma-70 factor (ECF subfamily)